MFKELLKQYLYELRDIDEVEFEESQMKALSYFVVWLDKQRRPTPRAADALRCEVEGCNEPAVMFYCEGHAP